MKEPKYRKAYDLLSVVQYTRDNCSDQAIENSKRAYALRDRVSEYEKFELSKNYHLIVTGNHDKALQICEQW